MQPVRKALAKSIQASLGGTVDIIGAAGPPPSDGGKGHDVAARHRLRRHREHGDLGGVVDGGDLCRVGRIGVRPILIPQDAKGDHGKFNGADAFLGLGKDLAVLGKVLRVKGQLVDAARTSGF